ncbi:hypothetical protein OHB26_12345 [Nocardia sp. NBC_01503]|uniref:hypothetical protein n=1 Tax=Nocardia sp. NBC_01503 TaxID=2975997 RepID=UPI002E7B3A87|nr:hypothetical protein [Nocardia sp. NBC_01503]WTL34909.1 hypothetical protein OHB26_12345 [Nocardia sp. NBC_01503]
MSDRAVSGRVAGEGAPGESAPNPSGRLAEQQAALVRALVAGASVPAGFDAADISATAHALLHKRADEVARRFPLLAHACGGDFTAKFMEWASSRPKNSTAADAAAFASALGLPAPARGSRDPLRRWRNR